MSTTDTREALAALQRLMPAIEKGIGGLVFTADKAGEIAADMNTLRAALATQPAQPVERKPDGYAYRYSDGIRFNNGCEVNGSKPSEAIPFFYASPQPAQPSAHGEAVTLADVLDALNVFNKPRPSEGDEPWTENDFISVKHLPDFINIIAVAWFDQPSPMTAMRVSTPAAPAQAVPLTRQQINDMMRAAGWQNSGIRQADLDKVERIVRIVERGIKAAP